MVSGKLTASFSGKLKSVLLQTESKQYKMLHGAFECKPTAEALKEALVADGKWIAPKISAPEQDGLRMSYSRNLM